MVCVEGKAAGREGILPSHPPSGGSFGPRGWRRALRHAGKARCLPSQGGSPVDGVRQSGGCWEGGQLGKPVADLATRITPPQGGE